MNASLALAMFMRQGGFLQFPSSNKGPIMSYGR